MQAEARSAHVSDKDHWLVLKVQQAVLALIVAIQALLSPIILFALKVMQLLRTNIDRAKAARKTARRFAAEQMIRASAWVQVTVESASTHLLGTKPRNSLGRDWHKRYRIRYSATLSLIADAKANPKLSIVKQRWPSPEEAEGAQDTAGRNPPLPCLPLRRCGWSMLCVAACTAQWLSVEANGRPLRFFSFLPPPPPQQTSSMPSRSSESPTRRPRRPRRPRPASRKPRTSARPSSSRPVEYNPRNDCALVSIAIVPPLPAFRKEGAMFIASACRYLAAE